MTKRVTKDVATRGALALAAVAALTTSGAAQEDPAGSISGTAAREHIGAEVTVCGLVASARYVPTTAGRPTFLNIDRPYPDQTLVVVIPGVLRERLGRPEETLQEARVCATGVIEELSQPAGLLRIVLERVEDLVVVGESGTGGRE